MKDILNTLGISDVNYGACSSKNNWSKNQKGGLLKSYNPATGELIAAVYQATNDDYESILSESGKAKIKCPSLARLGYSLGIC